jgi:serine protease Do
MTAAEVYKANVNSTVGITTSINTNYFGYKTTAAASGSGFIISSDGYIVTNHHVIDDANKITVTLYDGKKYEGELVGSNESNDITVVKIDAQGLTPVKLGSSGELNVGDEVAAIGNPLGELTFSLTKGVVSALDRTITAENTTMSLIQTDAAINAGNSGGALFNMKGEVVGVTNAKYSSSGMGTASIDNIGFAIPIDNVKSIINSLIKNGYAASPYIGVGVAVSSAQSESEVSGAVIKKVYDDSPAQQAGIKEGDIITEVNGKKIKNGSELTSYVKTTSKGDKMVCKVDRDGTTLEVTITVDEKESASQSDQSTQERSKNSSGSIDDYDIFGNFPLY